MQRWNVLKQYKGNENLLDLLLENRGIFSAEDKEMFLNPPQIDYFIKALTPEFKLNLKKARDLIKSSLTEEIPLIIHGDYDADGICATAIIYKALKDEIGYEKVIPFIPNRFSHGYGLSVNSINEALRMAGGLFGQFEKALFITVDSGITAREQVAYVKGLGHNILVTDHHQKPSELPGADVIVWDDTIVGSTISWLLSKSIGSKDPQLLSLAGIATVTDVQSLTGFNRTLVKKSLEILNIHPPLGIKKLLSEAGKDKYEITAYDLGWVIGPRLNAAGRIEDARHSLELLIENDPAVVERAARKLNMINLERQGKTLKMFEVAAGIESAGMPKVIITHDDQYHEGIIGLVASRLAQKYYRPAIVMSLEEGYAKGSVRSVEGVDIISYLRNFEDLFVNVGGHPMAAGFTIEIANLELFKERFTSYCNECISEELLVPVMDIDVEFTGELPELEVVDKIEKLKPFGVDNHEPKFLSRKMGVTQAGWVGSSKQHLSLRLLKDGKFYKAIYFGAADKPDNFEIKLGDTIDVVYKLKKDSYNGDTYLNLIVVDLKNSE